MATHVYKRESEGLTISKGTSHTFTVAAFAVPAGERLVRFQVCKGIDVSSMELQQLSAGLTRPSWDTWLTDTSIISWNGGTAKVKVKNNRTNNQSFRVYINYETEDLPTYSITCRVNGSGTLTSNKSSAYQGQQVTLTPKPATGYAFSKYTTSPAVTISSNKFTMPASAVVITATFTKDKYAVTVASADSSMGTVSGSGTYAYGSEVTISAEAKPGYKFTHWTVTKGSVASATSPTTKFTVPSGAATVTAHFERSQTIVKVRDDDSYIECYVSVYEDGAWHYCDAYVYDDGEWKLCSHV